MAQTKVNDFFLTRKKRDTHPAKRRKVEVQPSNSLSSQTDLSVSKDKQALDLNPTINGTTTSTRIRSRSSCQSNAEGNKPQASHLNLPHGLEPSGNKTSNTSQPRARHGLRSKASRSTRSQNSKQLQGTQRGTGSSGFNFKSQKKITDLLEFKFPLGTDKHTFRSSDRPTGVTPTPPNVNESNIDAVTVTKSGVEESISGLPEESMLITEEITSIEDDHWSSRNELTPRKRNIHLELEAITDLSKTRKCKVPYRRGAECPSSPTKSAKKKLELDSSETTELPSETAESDLHLSTQFSLSENFSNDESKVAEKEKEGQSGKNFLIRLVSEVESPDMPLSPLAMTPERSSDSESVTPEPQDKSPSPEPCSPKLRNLSQKLKGLSKMNGKALKNRLKQNGKLEDVKQKIDNLGKALDKTEEAKAAKDEGGGEIILEEDAKKDDTLQAYQRFEHLAKKGIPTLALPFSYKSLEGTFQAMDSVVSMLHNRSEMCTYSKLKAAVQNFTKKNFEEKAVGQIKTVAPDAYIFRQEKNVCIKENKKGYALTIEADLSKEVSKSPEETMSKTPEGKPVFTASALIHRKQFFHSSLLGLVMKQHKAFLASLRPPLNIPDSKITRWHPRFQLDQVPDIVPSPLPQPPDVRVYHSAKDVLNAQRGRLNPRVEEALAKVAKENKEIAAASAVSTSSPPTSGSKVSSSSAPATANSPSMKGIPPALLAKIRAKEALKMEAAMTRDPEEDSKTKMMGHLPEMIRIIRSYFITEKKPALPLEAIYKKLEDSYRSGISRKDVELHVKLMAELVPELVSVVEIKRGVFLKLDRNVDTQAVAKKIMNMVKSRK